MLSELLQKLESEHGISPQQGSGILNTIAEHIKQQFPQIGGMIDGVLGTTPNTSNATTAGFQNGQTNSSGTLEQLEEMAKSKLGGLFGN